MAAPRGLPGDAQAPDRAEAARPFLAIGIDVGGTKVAGGLVAFPRGEVSARRRISTGASRGPEAVLDDVLRMAAGLVAEAKARGSSVEALGLGLCEIVDRQGRVASGCAIDWRGLPVLERLSAVAPAVLEADVRAAALAEALFGAGRASRCFLYVTAGTGISSSLVVDGKPFTGAHGAAGTMASGPLSFTCPGCGREDRRTLEEIASGPALVERYNALGGAATRGEDLLAAEKRGDTAAAEVLRSGGRALGMGIGWLVNVLDPDRVVVGGGLGLGGGTYWDAFVASTRLHIWSDAQRGVPIFPAATGPDAGVIGAAAAAWRRARG